MKTIKDFDLKNKKVIIRVDFNVPINNGIISDDNRIIESLDTIKYAIKEEAKVILMSHLGRIKDESDLIKNDLLPISKRLSEKLNKKVVFINETRGEKLEKAINDLNCGDVLLMQNTRYEDLDGNKESSNDPLLSKYWASLGDIFINDAFGTCHRSHASNVGIASILPSGVGFLVLKELESVYSNHFSTPVTFILGGSKVSDKIGLINNLIDKCDHLLIGGAMAYTFIKAKGIEVGKSIVEDSSLEYCRELLKKTNKIILPIDHICSKSLNSNEIYLKDYMEKDDIGFDIGEKTIILYSKYISESKTVIWNGPVGMFENKLYENGTKFIAQTIANTKCYSIIGGGDTANAVTQLGLKNKFTHVSTGGGAFLELIEGKKLPGIEVINNK